LFAAHRVVWELERGAIARGALLRQTCGNKICCNPNHMRVEDRKSWTQRRWSRRREQNFWSMVERSGDAECWPWKSQAIRKRFTIDGAEKEIVTPMRAAWTLTRGPVPVGHRVYRTCDTPACCNPRHLVVRSRSANRAIRARAPSKPRRPSLTASEISQIRELYGAGSRNKDLADRFNVAACTISTYTMGIERAQGLAPSKHKPAAPAVVQITKELTESLKHRRANGESIRTLANETGLRPLDVWKLTGQTIPVRAANGRRSP